MSDITLTETDIINILKMLKSEDSENWTVAFTAVENMNFTKNIGGIFILYKYGYPSHEMWSSSARQIWHIINKGFEENNGGFIRGFPSQSLVLKILKFYSASEEQIELFKKLDNYLYPGDLAHSANKLTIDFLEEVIKTINTEKQVELYENSTTEERGTSES